MATRKCSGWRIRGDSAKLAAMNSRTLLGGVLGVALVLGATLGLRGDATSETGSVAGSSASGAGAPPAIDSVRLLNTLSVLAHDSMEGRRAGTPGGARARTFVLAMLAEAGVRPLGDTFEVPFGLPDDRGTGVNLVGLLPGSVSSPHIVLSAHYDHVGVREGRVYNGADDNASGTAAALEIARVLLAEPTRHPVVLALFDAEEAGLLGARHFISDPPVPLSEIALNVNMDMVARTRGVLWAAGAFHTPALRRVLETAAAAAPLTLRLGHDRPGAPEGDDWTTQSDHEAFHDAGIPFVYFGVEDHPDYHRPTDDFQMVDPAEFVNSARTVLAALRALDAALPLSSPEPPR
jgi:hypothetical protein